MDLSAFTPTRSRDVADQLSGSISSVDEDASTVMVTAVAFDGGEQLFGPCPVMPRGTDLPAGGEPCLIVRDQAGGWWVACWTPNP